MATHTLNRVQVVGAGPGERVCRARCQVDFNMCMGEDQRLLARPRVRPARS